MRVLPIPDLLVDALKEWKKLRTMQELMTKAPVSKADDFLFANNNGEMRSYHGTRTMFNRLLKKHRLEDAGIHFYKLRHTAFSGGGFRHIERGVCYCLLPNPKKAVFERFGQSEKSLFKFLQQVRMKVKK